MKDSNRWLSQVMRRACSAKGKKTAIGLNSGAQRIFEPRID